jgi:hypothetical protein
LDYLAGMSNQITTTSDVIRALGGTKAACEILGVKQQAISVWRVTGVLPPHTFPIISQELLKRGLSADLSLWRWERKKKIAPEQVDAPPAG